MNAGGTPRFTVFPFLINKDCVSNANQDRINPTFTNSSVEKWPVHFEDAKLPNHNFPPSRTLLRNACSNVAMKECQNGTQRKFVNSREQGVVKEHYCPSIVNMNNIMFCQNGSKWVNSRPKRIVNGFFPKQKKRHGKGFNQPNCALSQVDMCLTPKKQLMTPRPQTDTREHHYGSPHKPTHRPHSLPNYTTHDNLGHLYEENFDMQTHSAWSVRNGLPSPWLERYKIKKQTAALYSTVKEQNCDHGHNDGAKRQQKYVTLSCATIFDAF